MVFSNYTGLTVKGSTASRPAVNFTNATQGEFRYYIWHRV